MPWYRVKASIWMEIQSPDEQQAREHAETICHKRVVGQGFGSRYNDRGEVKEFEIDEVENNDRCPDCGEEGEDRGHMGCQYPSNDPNIEGLEDPMMYER